MKIKAIIFDMDGTIIDTTDIWSKATDELIRLQKPDITPELLQAIRKDIHGLALKATCNLIKDCLNSTDSVEELVNKKINIVSQLYSKGINFIPGFQEFYNYLKVRKLDMAVATNADAYSLKLAKNMLKLDNFFGNHIYDISYVNNIHKPNPDVYLYALNKINMQSDQCIAIEDSANGIKAAKSAGIFCIGLNTSGDLETLSEADHIVDKYQDIDLDAISFKYF